jgi:hypothetical protein
MANRVYFWTQNNTQQDTNSTDYTDVATLTFTPNASKNYMIYACFTIWSSGTSYPMYARLYDATAAAESQPLRITPTDADNKYQQHFMIVFSSGASPTSQSYKIQIKATSGGTTYIDNIRLIALELGAKDVFASSTGETTTTTVGTLYAKVTVAAGSTGYFTTVTRCALSSNDASVNTLLDSLILINTTGSTPLDRIALSSADDRMSCGGHRVDNIGSASYNLGVLYRLYAGSHLRIDNAWVVGLYMDDFDDWVGLESDPGSTTTSTTIANDMICNCYGVRVSRPLLCFQSTSMTLSNTTYHGYMVNRHYDDVLDVYVTEPKIKTPNTGCFWHSHSCTIFEQGINLWMNASSAYYVSNSGVTLTRRYEKAVVFELTTPKVLTDAYQSGSNIIIDWTSDV